jgi:hypothetical protein
VPISSASASKTVGNAASATPGILRKNPPVGFAESGHTYGHANHDTDRAGLGPEHPARIDRAAARTARNVPRTLTAIVRSQNSAVISSSEQPSKMPAETTNPESGPRRSTASLTARSKAPSSETSARTAKALPPLASISPKTFAAAA